VGNPDDTSGIDALYEEISHNELEDQVALRGKERYVARLVRFRENSQEPISSDEPAKQVNSADHVFQLEVSKLGVLDNLLLREYPRRVPGSSEVEICVKASGLNFRDVMKAMGLYPGGGDNPWFGDECSGIVTAVGKNVKGFVVGDEVIAVAAHSLSAYVITSELFVVRKPSRLEFSQAATIPIAFLTAYYCLCYLGRLAKGERVLIHTASGGVGLAAIQLAQYIGAEVFATAGSHEKREFLLSLGVRHVSNSRTLDFADEIMELTQGEGIDMVLNSLTGEAIPKGIAMLRPYGRFMEIGKRDILRDSKIGLLPFQNNLSFSAVDMDQMFRRRQQFSGQLLREVFALLDEGAIKPLPMTGFAIADIISAFKHMANAKHIGKIVLSFEPQQVLLTPARFKPDRLRDDRAYLITGGLGALGLKIADWMVVQGARHIILMGRSGPSSSALEVVEKLKESGAEVYLVQADVADLQQLKDSVEEIERTVPLAGIIHAAAAFDDAFLTSYDSQRFKKVVAAKAYGAWNLHTVCKDKSLDFFILFSSIAAIFGSAGQSSYCAANAFLDALAHYRCYKGLPALSINWGPWAEVGKAVSEGTTDAFRGITSMPPDKAIDALARLFGTTQGQVSVVPIDVRRWRQVHPMAAESPLLEGLAQEQREGDSRGKDTVMRKTLLAMEFPQQRREHLESHLVDQISSVLSIPRTTVDRTTSLSSLGFESLMAFELRNRLEDSLGVSLSATLVWGGHANIAELCEHLAEKMEISIAEASSGAELDRLEDSDELSELLDEIEQLDGEEVHRLLADID